MEVALASGVAYFVWQLADVLLAWRRRRTRPRWRISWLRSIAANAVGAISLALLSFVIDAPWWVVVLAISGYGMVTTPFLWWKPPRGLKHAQR
jgi:uncharacterized PurR-regulated membrane protein YhhQ (DUF165 family)